MTGLCIDIFTIPVTILNEIKFNVHARSYLFAKKFNIGPLLLSCSDVFSFPDR